MFTIVGNCPQCGSPLYIPSVWHGITPPPTTRSCWCPVRTPSPVTVTVTNVVDPTEIPEFDEKAVLDVLKKNMGGIEP